MTGRERVLAALARRETDRVPIDLGGMDSTGITGIACNRFRRHLGLAEGVRIFDPFQQVAIVEDAVLAAVHADVAPLMPEPARWQAARLPDGSPCEAPAGWNPEPGPRGSLVVRDGDGVVRAEMPAGGLYFEPRNPPLAGLETVAEIERNARWIETFDLPSWADEDEAVFQARARRLAAGTRAVMGNFAVHLYAAGQLLRGYEQFMMDLIAEPAVADCILDRLTETYIARFDRVWKPVSSCLDVVNVNDDLGMQDGPQISPELFRKRIKPFMRRLYGHIRRTSDAALFLHSDGSLYDLLPDLIDAGVQIVSPVQFTCRNMDLRRLKSEFGADLVFWGGGCDTQRVLPYASPEEVRRHVRENVAILAPGGGFVFTQVHNIQPDVPPENVSAMFEAAAEPV